NWGFFLGRALQRGRIHAVRLQSLQQRPRAVDPSPNPRAARRGYVKMKSTAESWPGAAPLKVTLLRCYAVALLLPLCAMVEAPLAKVAAASSLRARAGQWSSSQSSCGEVCAAAPASAAAPPSPTSAEPAA